MTIPRGNSPRTGVRWSRRGFMAGVAASGFALAVQPISAQTITTDTKGLTAGRWRFRSPTAPIPAYRAMPQTGGPFPVVLVVQEIFGVHEHIKDVCRRLAKAGYLAIAPELYARQGDVSKMTDIQEIIDKVVSKVPDAQVMTDLDATVAWAKASRAGDTAKLGITGFCWGGRIVWLYAAHNPRAQGRRGLVRPPGRAQADRAAAEATRSTSCSALKAPVLGLYGGADQGIPLESVEQMRAALKAAGTTSEIVVYPDAPHGFNADYRPSYRKDAARGRLEADARLVQEARRRGAGPAEFAGGRGGTAPNAHAEVSAGSCSAASSLSLDGRGLGRG